MLQERVGAVNRDIEIAQRAGELSRRVNLHSLQAAKEDPRGWQGLIETFEPEEGSVVYNTREVKRHLQRRERLVVSYLDPILRSVRSNFGPNTLHPMSDLYSQDPTARALFRDLGRAVQGMLRWNYRDGDGDQIIGYQLSASDALESLIERINP